MALRETVTGVARAQGEWIVFIDDDCIAQPGYLSAYAATIKADPLLGAPEGRIFPDRPRKTWARGAPRTKPEVCSGQAPSLRKNPSSRTWWPR